MTYLEIVNSVLRKLREEEVTIIDENDYSKLIGDFVNDALHTVEAAWDWSSLRDTITLTTTADNDTYSLTDFSIRGEVMSVYNVTKSTQMNQRTKAYIIDKKYTSTLTGTPRYWALNGTDANNDTQMLIYPTPDGAYTVDVNVVLRNQRLVNDADTTKLPVQPIVQLAFAYALRERGETGGQGAMEQMMVAQQDLSNAIALDAGNNGGELVFDVL
jgi:hypothetical protein